MIIKFTKDYIGRETAMQEYKAGTQVDLPTAQALALMRLGVARELWTEIGKLYDPKPVTPAPVVEEAKEAQPKPRKGKVKRDKKS